MVFGEMFDSVKRRLNGFVQKCRKFWYFSPKDGKVWHNLQRRVRLLERILDSTKLDHRNKMLIYTQVALKRCSLYKKMFSKIYSKFSYMHTEKTPSCQSAITINLQSKFTEIALWHGCTPKRLL